MNHDALATDIARCTEDQRVMLRDHFGTHQIIDIADGRVTKVGREDAVQWFLTTREGGMAEITLDEAVALTIVPTIAWLKIQHARREVTSV